MKKELILSLLASIALHTAVIVPIITPQYTYAAWTSVLSTTSTTDSCGEHEYDPTEHDEPHEKMIDKIFCYAKKALKMLVGAAIAGGAAFKLFQTYWK